MTEIGTLTSIRDAYAKRVEECNNKLIELQLEILHCIRMKDCYDYLINIRGGVIPSICPPASDYIDTDIAITKSLLNDIYGKNGEGKGIYETYSKKTPPLVKTGDEDEY